MTNRSLAESASQIEIFFFLPFLFPQAQSSLFAAGLAAGHWPECPILSG
jgi:hypothetical protein